MLPNLLILSLANYAIAVLITRSVMFGGFRQWVRRRSMFFGDLVSCPYCMGHWTGAVLTALSLRSPFAIPGSSNWIGFILASFAVIGLSAFFSYGWLKLAGFDKS